MPTLSDVALKLVQFENPFNNQFRPFIINLLIKVHGIVHDTIDFVHKIIKTEMNSATDNPIVLPERGEVSLLVFFSFKMNEI